MTATLCGMVISAPCEIGEAADRGKGAREILALTPIGTTAALIARLSNQGL